MGRGLGGASADAEFDDFVVAVWPSLVWSAYLLCGDRGTAEDLAQSSLARIYARWSTVRRTSAQAYARRTLVNLNTDRIRRHRPTTSLEEAPERARVETAAEVVDDRDLAVRLLAPLTQRERQVLVLRYVYDLTEAQVAEELGLAVGTVKSAHARALSRVRAEGRAQR